VNEPSTHEGSAKTYEQPTEINKERSKNRKWIFAAVAAVIAIVAGGWWLSNRGTSGASGGAVDSTMVGEVAVPAGKYTIIIYEDNTGDFFTPSGGRICGFKLGEGRTDPLRLDLTKTIMLLGFNTNQIHIYRDRLFADYSSFYNYTSSFQPDTTAGIPMTKVERDRTLIYAFDIPEGQIDKFNAPKHEIGPNDKNEYTMILYDDEHGHLFDSDGSHICGVEKRVVGFRLSKTINLYNESIDLFTIKNNRLYTNTHDETADDFAHDGDISRSKVSVRQTEEGDAVIYHFSMTAESGQIIQNDRKPYTSSSSNMSSSQNDGTTSLDEFRKKVDIINSGLPRQFSRNIVIEKVKLTNDGVIEIMVVDDVAGYKELEADQARLRGIFEKNIKRNKAPLEVGCCDLNLNYEIHIFDIYGYTSEKYHQGGDKIVVKFTPQQLRALIK
jgi:hypothetical protein